MARKVQRLKEKQWIKIATMSAPIVALVLATIFGLGEEAQSSINEGLLIFISVIAGGVGVGGVVANNDKNSIK